ncbi:MAG: hypothetical protein ACSHYF_11230 [Verrucomicrobiaceae bacterium]
MNSTQVDRHADRFEKRTGIDLRQYRHHDLAKSLSGIASLEDFSQNHFRIPLLISYQVEFQNSGMPK